MGDRYVPGWIVITPPSCGCGDIDFDPEYTNEIESYGISKEDFEAGINGIKNHLYRSRRCCNVWLTFAMFAFFGVVTAVAFGISYAVSSIGNAIYFLPVFYAGMGGVFAVAILFACAGYFRSREMNTLPKTVEKFNTKEITWQTRMKAVTCGQVTLNEVGIQVVPRASQMAIIAERITAKANAGFADDEFEPIVPSSTENICLICCERVISTTVLPCNHRFGCILCSKKVGKCPICREAITDFIRDNKKKENEEKNSSEEIKETTIKIDEEPKKKHKKQKKKQGLSPNHSDNTNESSAFLKQSAEDSELSDEKENQNLTENNVSINSNE